MKPTKPGELADEENDPRAHRDNHHPSLPPKVVSSACFVAVFYFHSFVPNYPIKKGGHLYEKIGNARCLPLGFRSSILVSLRVFREKSTTISPLKSSTF